MAKRIKLALPTDLAKETYDYINSVVAYLNKADKLNGIDSGALLMLADAYNTYVIASRQIREEGITVLNSRGVIVQHPAYSIMKTAMAQSMDILRDFGLTLKSRSKLNVIDTIEEESPLSQFFKENN